MDAVTAERALAGIRFGVGVGAWAAPGRLSVLLGIDADDNPQLPYVARLFGARDVALAAGVAMSRTPEARRLWLRLGVVCDVLDVGAAAIARQERELSPLFALLAGGTAATAAALGLRALSGR